MKRSAVLTIAALAIAALGVALACGSNPIIVATINADAGSIPCELSDAGDASACPDGRFCSTLCGQKNGLCEAIGPAGCETSGPECGCNRITYFDSCTRQAARVSRAEQGPCAGQMGVYPMTCFQAEDCRFKNASCAFVLPFTLPVPDGGVAPCLLFGSAGICWALPENPSPQDSGLFQNVCEAPGSQCMDEWSAIRKGGVYYPCALSDASAD